MYWFEYEFNTPKQIVSNIKLIQDFNILDFCILLTIFVIFLLTIYYIIPYLKLLISYKKKESEKQKRKKLIKTIAIQKDLDDEIEKELKLK